MKKLFATIIVSILSVFCFASCGTKTDSLDYNSCDTQSKSLMEVKSNMADIAVIDSVMANYYMSKSNFSDLKVLDGNDFIFDSEYYAIGFRKGSNAADFINYALYTLQKKNNNIIAEIGNKYGLTNVLCNLSEYTLPEVTAGSDYAYIKNNNKLVIGYTVFEPISFTDDSGTFTGFDTDLAKAACAILGIEANFVLINWETKEQELKDKSIDCIWNGFTYSDARAENITFSSYYMINKQVMVIRKTDAEKYTAYSSMKKAAFVAEAESAGEETIKTTINKKIYG